MLLKFADHPGDNVEMRTHSMNILRALYRHTELGEEISPYIANGVIAAINGFTKKSWAVGTTFKYNIISANNCCI